MCDTSAYVIVDGAEELLLESVQEVRQDEGELYMRNLFGEEKTIKGVIKEISFRTNRILITRTA